MKLDILAIAAHPDDVEVAAGGTLLRHVGLGRKVGILDLTRAELSTRGNPDLRFREAVEAGKILGLSVREQLDLRDGFFTADEASLFKVISKLRKLKPEIILTNAIDDRHPDHSRGAALVMQAVFLAGLVRVETVEGSAPQQPWRPKAVYHMIQDKACQPDFVVDISPYIDQKFEAIRAFKSQFYDPDCTDPETPISCPSFFDSLKGKNAILGRQIGVEYAEGFTIARMIGVKDLFDLV